MARILKFLDASGCELQHINDPEERLPIPVSGQVVTIGSTRLWIDSVTALRHAGPTYLVFVRPIGAKNSVATIC